MDPTTLLFIYRILIVLGGILSIYLGYRLFYLTKDKQGDLSIKTGTQVELRFKDVAPGVFFALFGAGVLAFSLIHGISITYPHANPGTSQAPTARGNPATASIGGANQGADQSGRPGNEDTGKSPSPDTHPDISGALPPSSSPSVSGNGWAEATPTAPAANEGRPDRSATDRPPP